MNKEKYKKKFNLSELIESIQKSHNTATGADEIYIQMQKQLPKNALLTCLQISNDIWTTDVFSENWHLATITPIPKPGKDYAEPKNHRPIALTNCLL